MRRSPLPLVLALAAAAGATVLALGAEPSSPATGAWDGERPWTHPPPSPSAGDGAGDAAGLAARIVEPGATATEADSRRVAGRVVDEEGRPVSGARVALAEAIRGDPPDLRGPEAARTDADGEFSLDPESACASWRVLVVADGVGAKAEGAVLRGVPARIVVRRAPALEGRVLEDGRAPVARARVLLLSSSPLGVWTCETESDAWGAWRLPAAYAEEFGQRVEVRAAGFAPRRVPAWWSVPREDGARSIEVDLSRAAEVRGVVLDEHGGGVAGARVSWAWESWLPPSEEGERAFHGRAVDSTATDSRGAFRLALVPATFLRGVDVASISVEAAGFGLETVDPPDAGEGGVAWREVRPRRTSEDVSEDPLAGPAPRLVEGAVTLPDGAPAVGAEVGVGDVRARTDARGAFLLRLHGTERGVVWARLPGFASGKAPLPEDDRPVDLRLLEARAIRVHVRTPAGAPAPSAFVSAHPLDEALGWHDAVLAGAIRGESVLEDVPRTALRVAAELPRGRRCRFPRPAWASARATVAAHEAEVTLVIGDPDAKPLVEGPRRSLRVTLLSPDGATRWTGPATGVVERLDGTAKEIGEARGGVLEFRSLALGPWKIGTAGAGIVPESWTVEVEAGEGWLERSRGVRRAARVGGRVVAPLAIDPADVSLRVEDDDGATLAVPVHTDGGLALDGIPAGRRRIVGESRIGEALVLASPTSIEARDGEETTTEWRFVRAGRVAVDATLVPRVEPMDDPGDRAFRTPRTRLTLRSAAGDVLRATIVGGSLCTREEGEPDLDAQEAAWETLAPPGDLVVRAEPEGGEAVEARVRVTAGATSRVVFTVR